MRRAARRHVLGVAALTGLVLAFAAPPAGAADLLFKRGECGSIFCVGTEIHYGYTSDIPEMNDVVVKVDGIRGGEYTVTFHDHRNLIYPWRPLSDSAAETRKHCEISFGVARCTDTDVLPHIVDGISVGLRQGNDQAVISGEGGWPVRASGGPGRDLLFGDAFSESLAGGPGNDRLYAGAGDDRLSDPSGANVLDAGPGNDVINFGVSYGPGLVDLEAILPDPPDLFDGGPGDDRILSSNGVADEIICGPGEDLLVADRLDPTPADCETITIWDPD